MSSKDKPGLWANIHAKRERIARGSGEKMRRPGTEGAPTAEALRESKSPAKTAAIAYEAGSEAAESRLGLTKTARRRYTRTYNYGGAYGDPIDPYTGYPAYSVAVSDEEPSLEELQKAQLMWHHMSPAERLKLTNPTSRRVGGGLLGALLGGGTALGLSKMLNASTPITALSSILGATGGGYLGSSAADTAGRSEAMEGPVPTHHAYDLARKQLAREAEQAVIRRLGGSDDV